MPELTVDRVKELLDYSPGTGHFTWKVNRRGSVRIGMTAGYRLETGYIRIVIDQHRVFAHRLAWFFVFGAWPKHHIDHINGQPADNRLANLRDVPRIINSQNERVARKRIVGGTMLGAHWSKRWKRWKSSIAVGPKKMHLGWFDTEQAAHAAYVAAKRKHHAGCTI